MNTAWSDYEPDAEGYVEEEYSFRANKRLGQEQLTWLTEEALNMKEGYSAVISAHYATMVKETAILKGIVKAFTTKSTYSGSYTQGSEWTHSTVSVDYTDAKGELIAIFDGSEHIDAINTTSYSIPLIKTTTAGYGSGYNNLTPKRLTGSSNESAIDVVTIDKNNRKIYLTRLGWGEDRVVSY